MRIRHGNTIHKHITRLVVAFAFVSGGAHATAVPGQGSWETTLLGRDINGHAVAITDPNAAFAYDKVLDATWYLTGNNTGLNWSDANGWAAGLTVGTFGGWALPAADPACGGTYDCTGSQMGELYYTALGNLAGGPALTNTGPFKNLQSLSYWTRTPSASNPDLAWLFYASSGGQDVYPREFGLRTLALRPGDLLVAVPEPETYAMLLAGLGLLAATLRRRFVP